jgi:protease-4
MSEEKLSDKQWGLLEKLLLEQTSEQKKTRRWGVFFKVLVFVYIFAGLAVLYPRIQPVLSADDEHVGLVRVDGVIAEGKPASANKIVTGLRRAFEAENSRAVILAINSPGGSPVQSGYVYDEVFRLKAKYPDKKVYAVIADLGASGGYYIASAADEIYANRASLVGSIGVVSAGFGFVGLMEKLGVDRRTYTAGSNKSLLDPFQPPKQADKEFWQQVLDTTHGQFVAAVKKGRGGRLADSDELFSGLIWSGEQALSLGLIDGLGSAGYVARDVVGFDEIIDYSDKGSPFAQLLSGVGVSVGSGLASALIEGSQGEGYQLR